MKKIEVAAENWKVEEPSGQARQGCGGTEGDKLGLEITESDIQRRTGHGAVAEGGEQPESDDEAAWRWRDVVETTSK